MLPLSFLIFIAHLVQAETSQSVVAQTEVVSSLIPPYATYNGPGSATYYASIVRSTVYNIEYAITCLPPSNLGPEEVSIVSHQDPCQTKLFGTGSQTFRQAKSRWEVTRTAASGNPVATDCQIADPYNQGPFNMDDTALNGCYIAEITDDDVYNEEQYVDGDFGMRRQAVTITGGLPEPAPTPNQISMTDFGATPTTAGPVVTITLHKFPSRAGPRIDASWKKLVIATVGISVVFATI